MPIDRSRSLCRSIDAAETRTVVIWSAGAEHVTAQLFVKAVIRVLVVDPRVGLVFPGEHVNLAIGLGPFFFIELQATFFKQLVDFWIVVAAVIPLALASPDIDAGIGIGAGAPTTERGL